MFYVISSNESIIRTIRWQLGRTFPMERIDSMETFSRVQTTLICHISIDNFTLFQGWGFLKFHFLLNELAL